MAPIGSIIAWVPRIDSKGQVATIPDCWVKCDGSKIMNGKSKWHKLKTPNLNKEGRFLRGGKPSDSLKFQEDAMQEHTHELAVSTYN